MAVTGAVPPGPGPGAVLPTQASASWQSRPAGCWHGAVTRDLAEPTPGCPGLALRAPPGSPTGHPVPSPTALSRPAARPLLLPRPPHWGPDARQAPAKLATGPGLVVPCRAGPEGPRAVGGSLVPSNTCVTSESVSQSPPPRSVSFLTFWHDAECFAENPACWIERWELRQPGRWCEVRRQPSEGSGCRRQRPRSPSVFLAGSPVTLSSPSVSLVTPGAPQGGATFQVSVSVFLGPVMGAVTSRMSPSSFLKLALVYCLSVILLRVRGKSGSLAARGPFSWVGRGWRGTRRAASPGRAGLCFGEALGVFTPSPPPVAGGAGTLLGSSPEKPAMGRVPGTQDILTVALAHAGRQQLLVSPRGPHRRLARRMRPGDRISRSLPVSAFPSRSRGGGSLCNLCHLMGLRKGVSFQFVLPFLLL